MLYQRVAQDLHDRKTSSKELISEIQTHNN